MSAVRKVWIFCLLYFVVAYKAERFLQQNISKIQRSSFSSRLVKNGLVFFKNHKGAEDSPAGGVESADQLSGEAPSWDYRVLSILLSDSTFLFLLLKWLYFYVYAHTTVSHSDNCVAVGFEMCGFPFSHHANVFPGSSRLSEWVSEWVGVRADWASICTRRLLITSRAMNGPHYGTLSQLPITLSAVARAIRGSGLLRKEAAPFGNSVLLG